MWRRFRLAKQFLVIDQHYAGQRIQGKRAYQEDDFGFDNSQPHDFLMVLADGLGGHYGGAYASNCAIQAFMDDYRTTTGTVSQRLQHALYQASYQLALETKVKPELHGMGCTFVGVALNDEEQLEWVSVGDSPLWLYDNAGRLHRLNADHSIKPFLQEQVQRGLLTPEAAARHPERNMLFSALTGGPMELVDTSPTPLELLPGDCLLLASDGLFTLSEEEITMILQQDLLAKELVQQLLVAVEDKLRWDQDNTTVLVVKIPNQLELFDHS